MKFFLLPLIITFSFPSFAQKGYIITDSNKKVEGWLKIEVGYKDQGKKISVYEDKKDKEPEVFYSYKLKEFKIENARYRILRNFYPFDDSDLYLTQAEARIISTGNVSLLSIKLNEILNTVGDFDEAKTFSRNGGPMFVLMASDGHMKAIKSASQLFIKVCSEFFSEDRELMVLIKSRKLRYENLAEIVDRYNKG